MKFYGLLAAALLLTVVPIDLEAQKAPGGVTLTTSGGVTFSADNPSLQMTTPASNSLIATITIASPKQNDTWSLTVRSANSNFTGSTGAPIPISNVRWSATATVISGAASVTFTGQPQNLSTSDVLVVAGLQGNKSPCTIQVTFNLMVNNSWTYDADTYLQNLILTATVN